MASVGALLANPTSWIFVVVILIVILYSLRSYFGAIISSLFFDYGIDAGLSEIDNFISGAGLAGLDIGDLAAGIFVFTRYKTKVGTLLAVLFTLEACNFFLGIIPGVGEVIETVFNFFPLITIVILLEQWRANCIFSPIKEYRDYLEQESPEIAKRLEPEYKEVKQLYDSYSYAQLAEHGPAKKEAFLLAIKDVIEERLLAAEQQLTSLPQEEARQYQQRIQAVKDEIETDWHDAASYAQELQQQITARAAQLQETTQTKAA